MRSVLFALSMCVLVEACALDPGLTSPESVPLVSDADESWEEARSSEIEGVSDFLPSNVCEDLCYEIYLGKVALCLQLPKGQQRACIAKAADELGACLKRCKGQ
ncbi:MAG: hypothetical protein QM820_08090 [Minicystis sp.]